MYDGERIRVDALAERIDTVPRTINGEPYHIWTQKREVSRLGEVKLLITKKESSNEDEELGVKYIVSNKIDAPASHLIALYAMRWRVESSSGTPSRILVLETASSGMPQVPVVVIQGSY